MIALLGLSAVIAVAAGAPARTAEFRAGTAFQVQAEYDGKPGVSATPSWYELIPDPGGRGGGYRAVEIRALRGRESWCDADAPTLARPGTHRVALSIRFDGDAVENWPKDFRAHEPAALTIQPLEWFIRSDDDPVGRMTELLGLPFVETPRKIRGLGHPTDLRLWVNCAGLAIYGARRTGRMIPYAAPPALRRYTTLVAASDREPADIPVRRGDLLHFGFQVAVVYEDRGRIGRLDPEDLILHAYHDGVEIKPFGELPYSSLPFEVRRW